MVQLLHKLKIRASSGPEVLLRCIKGPVTDHFPPGCRRIGECRARCHAARDMPDTRAPSPHLAGTSVTGELVDMRQFAAQLPKDKPTVFCVGSHAHGPAEVDWTGARGAHQPSEPRDMTASRACREVHRSVAVPAECGRGSRVRCAACGGEDVDLTHCACARADG